LKTCVGNGADIKSAIDEDDYDETWENEEELGGQGDISLY
jgi:hypothetical protein